ncbi:MAG TPA: efflux RND transporter permease subunit [Pirellulales bacterium]|nr:efflux RND transporter permease subunit [Pirellulales bacterium]
MNGLIRASLNNIHAVIVFVLTLIVLGSLTTFGQIPIDILPVFKSPAVQVLTFYGGMPAEGMEKDITNRMERWVGQSNGMKRQESRSIVGASIVRNYFFDDVDPNGALTQVNSLALGVMPNLPPGTLPPVVLPFDPTGTVPVCLVALNKTKDSDRHGPLNESVLYDLGRYEVRNMIMSNPGASAPVVFGGKIRAVMIYCDRTQMQARDLSPMDVMKAVEDYNVFVPAGDLKIGAMDYALMSNSLYDYIETKPATRTSPAELGMEQMPLVAKHGKFMYLGDVAKPRDAAYIQTNIVRVGDQKSSKQVYIPVYRQQGASTLAVVDNLAKVLPGMQDKLSRDNIQLKLVMDQSIYVRASIRSLVQEGMLGSVLCSLTILMFLGEWRMTLIAIMTLPISVLSAVLCLYYTGNTINVMTLAGLTLAIGPMVDSAIICLENTHRHLTLGAAPREAAYHGASEVAMPELVSTICTFLVLAPLALMGSGKFLFKPMALAVAFSMITAYILSRTLVPSFSAFLLHGHAHDEHGEKVASRNPIARAFARWEAFIDQGIAVYVRTLNFVLRWQYTTIFVGYAMLAVVLVVFAPIMRRDFFPEVDSGAFEMIMRGKTGLRIDTDEGTEGLVKDAEKFVRKQIPKHDLELIVSELGVTADWSAAYTPNSGPMDTIMKIQLTEERGHSAQHYVRKLREGFAKEKRFAKCEFAFDAGGMVRGALNEGKSTPINVRITGKNLKVVHRVGEKIREAASKIDGIVDARMIQKLDYPAYVINVDRPKAADLGLTQADVMRNVIAATNCSISFNKRNFWIDPIAHNQYFVGVQYEEAAIQSFSALENIPITGGNQSDSIVLKNLATIGTMMVPSEVDHLNIQPTIDVSMGVEGRDLGHVCDDLAVLLNEFGEVKEAGVWKPYDPDSKDHKTLVGSELVLSGEYARMQDTFKNLSIGLILASLLIYFLMVGLDQSAIVPISVMVLVPLCLIGILPVLYVTGSAVNVQSLLGFIFIVGIKVANSVLMTDFAQEIRRHEGLSPVEAIAKAAAARVRPITMTALAAFFAMIPTAMALEKGSEANAPLGRAILGGLMAGEPATLLVLPCLYAVFVRDKKGKSLKQVEEEKYGTGGGHGKDEHGKDEHGKDEGGKDEHGKDEHGH